jgi:hypothetical protein
MDYSLPAWLGALVGTIIAVVIYMLSIGMLERRMRALQTPKPEGREEFETRLSILRRLLLGVDIAIFATLGYWIGKAMSAAGIAPPVH